MADWDDIDDALLSIDIEALVAQKNLESPSSVPPAPNPPSAPRTQFNSSAPLPRATCPTDLTTPLFQLFGHEQFREGQEDAVRATLQGRDAYIYWPTGKGATCPCDFDLP